VSLPRRPPRDGDPSLLVSDAATRSFVRGTARDRGFEHVAKFLLLLGAGTAARILSQLRSAEVTGIVQEVARIDSVEQREAHRILKEFGYLMDTRELYARGGAAAAAAMLRAAFGEEGARTWRTGVPAPVTPGPGSDSAEAWELGLLEAEDDQLRQALEERSDRQIACALAAAPAPVARRMRACLTPARRAAVEAQTSYAADVLAAVRAGALRALVRQVGRHHPGDERLQQ
jgi:flagellar motor switch protein FliG